MKLAPTRYAIVLAVLLAACGAPAPGDVAEAPAPEAAVPVTLRLVSLGRVVEASGVYHRIVYAATNEARQDIAGVKGVVAMADMFGDVMLQGEFSITERLRAGETREIVRYYEYREDLTYDVRLDTTPLEQIQLAFHAEQVIFADPQALPVPQ